ncbi:uncharacterized protein BJ212DRAFT_1301774 [Suillus subaureus]|uniref:DUF6532 domain-containing protein n=1 Tax=Suillus subaureus TaxID=48587 RepID=A0A9P7E5M3_9AGAM|nr:uncharacterized protein BJ212DRAFT_1301774 [Suillus subaureus]KAG1811733.1 hypothetical protein BJ212DRAFT_1301774 [Suillus subaureus]
MIVEIHLADADMCSISNSSEEHMDCTGSWSELDDELEEAENESQSATYEFDTDLIDGDKELDEEADDNKDGSVLDDEHKEQLLLDDSSEEEGLQDELDDAILGAEDGEGAVDTEEDYSDYANTLASASLAMPGVMPVRPVATFGTLPQTCGICQGLAECCVNEWVDGEWIDISFLCGEYKEAYDKHLANLKKFNARMKDHAYLMYRIHAKVDVADVGERDCLLDDEIHNAIHEYQQGSGVNETNDEDSDEDGNQSEHNRYEDK